MVSKVISAATLVLVTGENVDPPLKTDIHLKGAIKGAGNILDRRAGRGVASRRWAGP